MNKHVKLGLVGPLRSDLDDLVQKDFDLLLQTLHIGFHIGNFGLDNVWAKVTQCCPHFTLVIRKMFKKAQTVQFGEQFEILFQPDSLQTEPLYLVGWVECWDHWCRKNEKILALHLAVPERAWTMYHDICTSIFQVELREVIWKVCPGDRKNLKR